MKLLLIGSVTILAIFWLEYSLAQNNISWGNVQPGDRLLYKDTISKKAAALQKVTSDIIFIGYGKISCIKAMNDLKSGNGGYATLLKGGVGSSNVTIHLKSERGQGFNFTVEIYGR